MQTPLLTDQVFIFFHDAVLHFGAELVIFVIFWPFCTPIEVLIPGAHQGSTFSNMPARQDCMYEFHA